jgi:shikimate kinase / 3-dehydroquinate synthase
VAANALDRHVALVGFMGAGKTTAGEEVANRLGRPFRDLDRDVEHATGMSIPQLFKTGGEKGFRVRESETTMRALRTLPPAVLALGGGAVASPDTRRALAEHALTVLLPVDVDEAWNRVRDADRPLAQDEPEFRTLFRTRDPLYREVADTTARDVDGIVLAAAGIDVGIGAVERLTAAVGDRAVALVTDRHVAGIHGAAVQLALGERLVSTHELPPGEASKAIAAIERLWSELRLERGDAIVALGGGCTTDAAGFAAATYLRGIDWIAVPTTLVGQVDAAIGGKTALNLPAGKNLIGAFHWPARTVIDPALLRTLPDRERREGMAEVVKTGLLAGEPIWELSEPELVRRCASYKAAVCLRDPHDQGPRAALNLGHTFAHALEAAGDYGAVPHGEAVALGLLAALRLSDLDTEAVERTLAPQPVRVDRDRAWTALQRDKKVAGGRIKLVLMDAAGRPKTGVELPESDVRAALDALIRD